MERGNHHHDGTEWLLVTEGAVEVRFRASEEEPVQVRALAGDHPVLLEIPPGVRHSIRNTGAQTVYLVAFSDRERPITVKAPLA
jgi:quercetin dioxygenase-like cupin family protein